MNPHAFSRNDDFGTDLALRAEDLPAFDQVLRTLERDSAEEFRSGFIAEESGEAAAHSRVFRRRPQAQPLSCGPLQCAGILRRDRRERQGAALLFYFRSERCGVGGRCRRRSPAAFCSASSHDLTLRSAIRSGKRAECKTCVCSMWRDLDAAGNSLPPMRFAL